MYTLVDVIFGNIIFFSAVVFVIYIYKEYLNLKEKVSKIDSKFEKFLNNYIATQITRANQVVEKVLQEYGREDAVRTDMIRLKEILDKAVSGTVNQKVSACNALNNFKFSLKMDYERYPNLLEVEKLGVFTDIDLESITDDIAISRREYNSIVYEYNEKVSGFPMQYLYKLFKLEPSYLLFYVPTKQSTTAETVEVFDEKEPEINTIQSLNTEVKVVEKEEERVEQEVKPVKDIQIEYSSNIYKPTINIDDKQ